MNGRQRKALNTLLRAIVKLEKGFKGIAEAEGRLKEIASLSSYEYLRPFNLDPFSGAMNSDDPARDLQIWREDVMEIIEAD